MADRGRVGLGGGAIARDAIGIRPLYYARARDTFLFASEIKALLAHPEVCARPNEDTLAGLLTGSLYGGLQDETFFAGVSSLSPAHMAVITPRGVVQRRYWDFDPARKVSFRSFPEYALAFRHYFEQAVRRRLRSAHPVAVSVSGGLDSSAIFCLAETLRIPKEICMNNFSRPPPGVWFPGPGRISAGADPAEESGYYAGRCGPFQGSNTESQLRSVFRAGGARHGGAGDVLFAQLTLHFAERENREMKRIPSEIQDFLYALGKEALDENAEWLILHRARPLEPVMAG